MYNYLTIFIKNKEGEWAHFHYGNYENGINNLLGGVKESEINTSYFYDKELNDYKQTTPLKIYDGVYFTSKDIDDYITLKKQFYDEWLIKHNNIKKQMESLDYLKLTDVEKNNVLSEFYDSYYWEELSFGIKLKATLDTFQNDDNTVVGFIYCN